MCPSHHILLYILMLSLFIRSYYSSFVLFFHVLFTYKLGLICIYILPLPSYFLQFSLFSHCPATKPCAQSNHLQDPFAHRASILLSFFICFWSVTHLSHAHTSNQRLLSLYWPPFASCCFVLILSLFVTHQHQKLKYLISVNATLLLFLFLPLHLWSICNNAPY